MADFTFRAHMSCLFHGPSLVDYPSHRDRQGDLRKYTAEHRSRLTAVRRAIGAAI
jgi:hypothetical protein